MASSRAIRSSIFSLSAALLASAAERPDIVPGRYLVELHQPDDAAALRKQARLVASSGTLAVVETAEPATLRKQRFVKKVEPVYQGVFPLARAVERSNIAASWLNGPASGGRGMRIGIIDSGIDPAHPAFQTTDLQPPEGFPRARHEADLAYTNNKIIVLRNYQDLLRITRPTPLDTLNHGTATAGAAAAVLHSTPHGPLSGAAPGAYLGIYKVGPAGNGAAWQSDAVVLAIHDAIADGMDVISLSLGFTYGTPYGDTLLSEAIEKAERAGIIVVGAAGNGGPHPRTIGAISVSDAMITTGAAHNDRKLVNSIRAGGRSLTAFANENKPGLAELTGPLTDVETLDRDGLACRALPPGSLTQRIVLVLRGGCLFSEKIAHAAAAGATAVVFYTPTGEPFPVPASAVKLPAMMVNHDDGLALKRATEVTLDFRYTAVPADGDRVAAFSARGPSPHLTIEPDVAAVGETMLLPVPGGYQILQGTSFSAPLLAGAAAVLKQQRPGLTPAHYRSLLVNTASPIPGVKPQEGGSGLLDLAAALRSPLAAHVTSTVFGVAYSSSLNARREVVLTNLSAEPQTVGLTVEPVEGNSAPVAEPSTLQLAPGATGRFSLRWSAPSLTPGAYQGIVHAGALRIPYWAAVPVDRATFITPLVGATTWFTQDVVSFVVQVTDSAGLFTGASRPAVIPLDGPGLVDGQTIQVTPLNGQDGNYFVLVMLSARPGVNQFRIEAGAARATVSFAGVE